ncbi:coiled-coil and C2 domain-containing protein 1B isoform X1 [Lepisosteus oculatus]|uniref:coiled-coil and C2 domain-containing protein 1B isoform X1 n=1 Tax=Lepisosteus oculatus TaxID=7918 RepID=UPI00372052D1
MLGKKNRRAPLPKGQGAAAARQMGLFVDLSPEEMMDMDGQLDDADLEAEFAAVVGRRPAGGAKPKPKGKTPLPMEHIEKLAEECMKDIDEGDSDGDLEDDEDLLAELQEVVGEEEAEEDEESVEPPVTVKTPPSAETQSKEQVAKVPAVPGSVEHTLEERIEMYQAAISNAKSAGDSSKARRYERGLKTLQTMLASVRKGNQINEAEIPPPVASGKPSARGIAAPAAVPELVSDAVPEHTEHPGTAPETAPSAAPEEGEERGRDAAAGPDQESTRALLQGRQREYKIAAVKAKQEGDLDRARQYMRTLKKFDVVLEALESGQPVDLSQMPPPPGAAEVKLKEPSPSQKTGGAVEENRSLQAADSTSVPPAAPPQPRSMLEALEQRMAKYKEACAQAKQSGDDRKARMHDRIAKQYQSAIRAHKAGRPVSLEELPVPPGFPPIPGLEGAGADKGIAAALEAASRLTADENQEGEDDDGAEDEEHEVKQSSSVPQKPKKPMLAVPPTMQGPKTPSPLPEKRVPTAGLSHTAQQQLDFLESRRKQYMKAALQAKQKNDLEQARHFLRTAKVFEPMIEAARSGKSVDITKVPSPPGDEDEDFILIHHSDVQLSERAEEVYSQLAKILKEQYEKCVAYSKQFTHLGNITETTKFEKMAESCKKSLEILKLSQSQGLDPPKHHFEERTYKTMRIFPELSSTEMVVIIAKGINLPAPQGVVPNDLDAYVKFEFPYPSVEQAQKHKTAVIKNTNCPEYNQSFKLSINRNHRGFRRAIQSKGLKLEVFHKGGFLRSDKPVGTAHLKLEKLEKESEVREIIEVMDGRKPTGGRLEVKVRLREPLSGQDVQTTSERWLVLEQPKVVL